MASSIGVALIVAVFVSACVDVLGRPASAQLNRDAISKQDMLKELHNQPSGPGPNGLALTPTMGWMSWEIFRCEVDCEKHPTTCVSEQLYKQMTDHLAGDGYAAAGYTQISIDDCWENKGGRDSSGHLYPDASRFPSGMKALGDYMHAKNLLFGTYSDEGTKTCGGYPGSKGYDAVDAETFASWGVDYLKLDGCYNDVASYASGYPTMGSALQASGRNVTYSCSWPAYLGDNESNKPFGAMINAGCNSWRNWDDIQCNWESVSSIIDHWGDYGSILVTTAGPGHWHDMDMLLIGNDCITLDEERTQMAIWAISASNLFMGNDLRNVSKESRDILLNEDAIAVSQDPLGKMGTRMEMLNSSSTQTWVRPLAKGHVALALYNKGMLHGEAADIKVTFADVGLSGEIVVYDIWAQQQIGVFTDSYTAKTVPHHGTSFLRLSRHVLENATMFLV